MGQMCRWCTGFFLLLSGACYTAVPIESGAPPQGTRVYIELTDAGTVSMASQVGPSIQELFGDVVATTDRDVVIGLRAVTNRRQIESLWSGERVTVPRADIARVRARKLSTKRSAVFAGILTAGLLLTSRAVGLVGGGDGHRGELPVTQ